MNIFLSILVILVLAAGVFFITDRIDEIATTIKNLELKIDLVTKTQKPSEPLEEKNSEEVEEEDQIPEEPITEIPTSIIFSSESSPVLVPQTELLITIENARKLEENIIVLNIKAYSWKAESYSSLDPSTVFELVNLTGTNQKPISTSGQFNSIPPKNSINGTITFRLNEGENKAIIQIRTIEDLFFFEFDFERGGYQETVVG